MKKPYSELDSNSHLVAVNQTRYFHGVDRQTGLLLHPDSQKIAEWLAADDEAFLAEVERSDRLFELLNWVLVLQVFLILILGYANFTDSLPKLFSSSDTGLPGGETEDTQAVVAHWPFELCLELGDTDPQTRNMAEILWSEALYLNDLRGEAVIEPKQNGRDCDATVRLVSEDLFHLQARQVGESTADTNVSFTNQAGELVMRNQLPESYQGCALPVSGQAMHEALAHHVLLYFAGVDQAEMNAYWLAERCAMSDSSIRSLLAGVR